MAFESKEYTCIICGKGAVFCTIKNKTMCCKCCDENSKKECGKNEKKNMN